MLKLTTAQEVKIRWLQEMSFKRYCEVCGYDEHEHAALLFSLLKAKWNRVMQNAKVDILAHKEEVPALAILKQQNFLDMRRAEHEDRRLSYAATLANVAHHLPIAYEYTARLCGQLGLAKPTARRPQSIATLVESVPLLSSWELEFNAFMGGDSVIDGLPCICIYEALLSACNVFIDCVAPAAIDFGIKSRARSMSDCRALGCQSTFIERLHTCLRLLLGESNYSFGAEAELDSKTNNTILAMTEGSVQAVWFHEFGHLLLGHLEQPESHKIEFEADKFALKVMAADGQNSPFLIWLGLGGITSLVLIHVIETIKCADEGRSHPSGRRRIEAAVDFWEEANPSLARAGRSYLQSLAAVCDPTLQQHWGVSLYDT
jgi:hypothetical protein